MKIKCIENKISVLPQEITNNFGSISDTQFNVCPGKEYVVYALSYFYGHIWYCICEEDYTYYPMWNPDVFFEISDGHLSRYWIFSFRNDAKNQRRPFFSFPEWANDKHYYNGLTDGDQPERDLFKNYKEKMDLEFNDNSISEVAQIGDSVWVICPLCIDAWESGNIRDAMVKCPNCKTVLHNPRYITSVR